MTEPKKNPATHRQITRKELKKGWENLQTLKRQQLLTLFSPEAQKSFQANMTQLFSDISKATPDPGKAVHALSILMLAWGIQIGRTMKKSPKQKQNSNASKKP